MWKTWADDLRAETQSHAFTHLLFAISLGLCAYNFFRAISLDPGSCPKPASDAELKSVCPRPLPFTAASFTRLEDNRRPGIGGQVKWPDFLHSMHGEYARCTQARSGLTVLTFSCAGAEAVAVEALSNLRSLCRPSGPVRVIAVITVTRIDLETSHCPWVWNCGKHYHMHPVGSCADNDGAVGINNHRQFLLFVTTLVTGIILFDYLTYACKFEVLHFGVNPDCFYQTSQPSMYPRTPPTYRLLVSCRVIFVRSQRTTPSCSQSPAGPRCNCHGPLSCLPVSIGKLRVS